MQKRHYFYVLIAIGIFALGAATSFGPRTALAAIGFTPVRDVTNPALQPFVYSGGFLLGPSEDDGYFDFTVPAGKTPGYRIRVKRNETTPGPGDRVGRAYPSREPLVYLLLSSGDLSNPQFSRPRRVYHGVAYAHLRGSRYNRSFLRRTERDRRSTCFQFHCFGSLSEPAVVRYLARNAGQNRRQPSVNVIGATCCPRLNRDPSTGEVSPCRNATTTTC